MTDYDNIVIDGSSPFGRALGRMWEIHSRKKADYSNGGPWENFENVADQIGSTKEQVCEALIALKQSRLKTLQGKKAQNESVQDTVLDRAVYAAIRLAMDLELGELRAEQQVEEIAASDAALCQEAPDTQPIWIPTTGQWVRHKTDQWTGTVCSLWLDGLVSVQRSRSTWTGRSTDLQPEAFR